MTPCRSTCRSSRTAPCCTGATLLATGPDGAADIPALTDAARPASYRRQVTIATDPAVVRLVGAAGFLARFPVDGPIQRLNLARGEIALLPFTSLLDAAGLRDRVASDVAAANRRDQACHRR